jgi:hypothetical protein
VARTEYTPENGEFSNKSHRAARALLYPRLFGVPMESLSFEDTLLKDSERGRILDGEMGVDRIVRVAVQQLHGPLVFTVQERFRRPEHAGWRDLTITEWNHASNMPSELYKINAGLFLYGYYDEARNHFLDAIVVSVTDLLLAVTRSNITYTSNRNKKRQTFLGFKFDDMAKAGIVRFWLSKERTNREVASWT